MGLLDILSQYVNASSSPPKGDVLEHFDAVAQQVPTKELGGGIAAAMRSEATPSFGQTVSTLFSQSNPTQKAGVLNELLQVLGPSGLGAGGDALRKLLGSAGGDALGKLLGSAGGGAAATVTPAQATQVSPAALSSLASAAEQHDGSIVDRLGNFYAQHPTLVKTLGVAALSAVMSHMGNQRSA